LALISTLCRSINQNNARVGKERAVALAGAIGDMGITAIYCPDRGRNREAAQPLADQLGLTYNLIPEARLANTRKFADEFVREVISKHPIENSVPAKIRYGSYRPLD